MRIAVALSGGVDSAVAAFLLKEQGYDIVGITLILHDKGQYVEDARRVAEFLGIEHVVLDYSKKFKETVVKYFFETYKQGKTPNPCVYCNRFAKFKFLIENLNKIGADLLATGHYAKIIQKNGKKLICKSANKTKDQSYFLSFLSEEQIEKLIFPLEDMPTKQDTRTLAKSIKLPVAKKKESYEVCFIDDDYRTQLAKDLEGYGRGYFILNGEKLKEHEGIYNFTVGQRKGIKIAYREPLYVERIDEKTGNIYLSTKDKLYKRHVVVRTVNKIFVPRNTFEATAKLRSMMNDEKCIVMVEKDRLYLDFEEPQFAPAPGQVACVYLDNCVVLSGFIEDSF